MLLLLLLFCCCCTAPYDPRAVPQPGERVAHGIALARHGVVRALEREADREDVGRAAADAGGAGPASGGGKAGDADDVRGGHG